MLVYSQFFHKMRHLLLPLLQNYHYCSLILHLMHTLHQSLQSLPQTITDVQECLHLSSGYHTNEILQELGVTNEEHIEMIEDGMLVRGQAKL